MSHELSSPASFYRLVRAKAGKASEKLRPAAKRTALSHLKLYLSALYRRTNISRYPSIYSRYQSITTISRYWDDDTGCINNSK